MKTPATDEHPFENRRSGKDRRAGQTLPFTLKSLFGARGRFRRKEDSRKYYFVDLYSPFLIAVLLCTLILSIGDAFLTLRLVGENCQEINPVMRFFLRLGPLPFIFAKWLLTAFGLTVLLIFKNYYLWQGRIKTASLLVVFPFLYLILVTYEIYMVLD